MYLNGKRREDLEGTPSSGPEAGANPLQVTKFVTAAVCYIYTAQQRRVLRLTGFTEIGRALLAPVGGGTHQESRNNGDRLEPWKGHPAAGQNPVRAGVTGSGGNLFTSTALMLQRGREAARRAGSTQRGKLAPARTC